MRATLVALVLVFAGCGRDGAPNSSGSQTPAKPIDASKPELAQTAPVAEKNTKVIFELASGELEVEVEVVQTPATVQRGLMHRQHMAPDHGMLFVFASERRRSFWMKNTLIPLDMLFIKSDQVVAGVVRDAVPLTLDSRGIETPTRYVLELNGGWTAAHGVDAGTKLRFEDMPEIGNPPL